MKRFLFLCWLSTTFAIAASAQNDALLVKEIAKENGSSRSYTLVTIGSKGYLIKGKTGKVLKTKAISGNGFGYAESFTWALVHIAAANNRMQSIADPPGWAIFKKIDGRWQKVVESEGEYHCDMLRPVPGSIRRNLGIDECF